ncbi:MAG: exosortase C-terminal domain/associated protein EpsI, partial [Methylococcales bacterium]
LGSSPEITLPESTADWRLVQTDEARNWAPNYHGASAEIRASYSGSTGKPVHLYLFYYRNQKQGRELINSTNKVLNTDDKVWRLLELSRIGLNLSDRSFPVNRWRLGSSRSQMLVWEWYWVDEVFVANDFLAKLLEVKAKSLGRNMDSAAVIVSVEYQDSVAAASDVLRGFVKEITPSLEASLRSAARE